MTVPPKYIYLLGVLLSFIPWTILYWHRKDLRREMITMGILVTVGGSFAEYFWWTRDWWHPQTITGTRIGIEDILNGFSSGGIAAVLYEELFKKRIYRYKPKNHNLGALIFGIIFFLMIAYFIHLLKFTSIIASTIAMASAGIVLMILRKDLFYDALLTGMCMVIGVFPFYPILEYISPGFVTNTWVNANLSGINFMTMPIEDAIFYFLFGFFIAPFYLYWKNERLRKLHH